MTNIRDSLLRSENFHRIVANILLNGTNELEYKYIKVILKAWAILVAVWIIERKFEQGILAKALLRHMKLN